LLQWNTPLQQGKPAEKRGQGARWEVIEREEVDEKRKRQALGKVTQNSTKETTNSRRMEIQMG